MSLLLTLASGVVVTLLTGLDANVCEDKARLWMDPSPPPIYHGERVIKAECR